MLEIEVKYPVADEAALQARLHALGAHPVEDREDADHYFKAPDRDFRQTDEAFRLRRIGTRNFLTYKGPRAPGPTKTRLEIEVPFADGDGPAGDIETLLGHLGYRPVAVVRKRRRVHRLDRGGFQAQITLDRVERVGSFAEVEVVAAEGQAERAKEVVLGLAGELGLSGPENRSYLQLLLDSTRAPDA